MIRKCIINAVAAAAISMAPSAESTVIFTGSGLTDENNTAVTAEADFTLSVSALTVLLTNTSDPTTAQGDALTGVIFSINGNPTLSFDMTGPACGQTLGPGSDIWTSTTASNTTDPLCGSWTSQLAASPPFAAEFGVATSGFNGEFNGGSITLGNASPDYGIVAANTFPAASFGGSKFPFIQDSQQFVFTVNSGTFTEADITGVQFLFGTQGTSTIPGECTGICGPQQQAPEPASLALLGIAGLALAATSRRRGR